MHFPNALGNAPNALKFTLKPNGPTFGKTVSTIEVAKKRATTVARRGSSPSPKSMRWTLWEQEHRPRLGGIIPRKRPPSAPHQSHHH